MDTLRETIAMKHHRRFWMAGVLLLVAVSLGNGCGSQRGPAKITIRGTVTLDGQPLPEGQVVFIPDDPVLGAAGGTIVDGRFTVTTYKGPHKVEVHCMKQVSRPVRPGGRPEDGITFVGIIPPRYNEKTTLTFDVQTPKDQPALTLTSSP